MTLNSRIYFLLLFFRFIVSVDAGENNVDSTQKPGIHKLGTLGTLPADVIIHKIDFAWGLNNRGHVVGEAEAPAAKSVQRRAFLSIEGHMFNLGILSDTTLSCARAINEKDQIVGYSSKHPDSDFHAFLYENGTMKDLGTLGGYDSKAMAINNSGQIVGLSTTTAEDTHGFIYEKEKMRDLGTYQDFRDYEAYGINDAGVIVGAMAMGPINEDVAGSPTWRQRAFYIKDGVFHKIDGLEDVPSIAYSINNSNDIVGTFIDPKTKRKCAFLFSDGKLINLSAMVEKSKDDDAVGWRINNAGDVLFGPRNYLYHKGAVVDLTPVIEKSVSGKSISIVGLNDSGQFIFSGKTPMGSEAFLFTMPKGQR